MSRITRATIILLAGLWAGPAGAQMLGPTWETDLVLTQGDMAMLFQTLDVDLHGRAIGTVARWHNPTSGHSGTLRLMEDFFRSGQRCERIDYTFSAASGMPVQHWVFDTCRQPDGSWKLA